MNYLAKRRKRAQKGKTSKNLNSTIDKPEVQTEAEIAEKIKIKAILNNIVDNDEDFGNLNYDDIKDSIFV